MLLSPQRAHVILASKGTQLRSNEYVLFGVLVCFRHRRALTVHLCHLRSEHSGNVRIKRNPHYHVRERFTAQIVTEVTSTELVGGGYVTFYQNAWVGGWGVVTGNTHYLQISEFTRIANVTILILLASSRKKMVADRESLGNE